MPIPNPDTSDFFDRSFFQGDKFKNIFQQLKSDTPSFVNPLNDSIVAVSSKITDEIVPQLQEWEIPITGQPPIGFTQIDITNIRERLENSFLPAQLTFKSHTDLLSGVTQTTASDIPNLRSIISVGTSSVALDHALNDVLDNPCGQLLNSFSSLFLGSDEYIAINEFYQNLIATMNNGDATANQILGRIEAFENRFSELIDFDTNHFNNLVNDLLFASLASTLPNWLRDPCGRYMLENVIGTNDLLDIL